MVRSTAKQTPDEKKDSKKKSSSASSSGVKKKSDTGSWPCKMDGCKKVFAREADLKRHQRTTKTHSIPGFQCPQCDATFTRTDALRRHQKSRHNGVVIEPAEQDKGKHPDGRSSGSRSPSPSGTPSRSQGEGSTNGSPPAGQTGSAGSSGRASYYRPHTIQDGYYAGYPATARPSHGMMMDPHYLPPPIGIPTSATRGNWHSQPPPPPWVQDGHPMPPPPAGMYIPSYYPSPYYRHPGMPMPMPPQVDPGLLAQSNGHSNGVGPPESALRNTSADDSKHDGPASSSNQTTSISTAPPPGDHKATASPSVQEPGPNGASADEDAPDAAMAAAALQAVLAFQKEQEIREAANRSAAAAAAQAQSDASAQPRQSQSQGQAQHPKGSAGPSGTTNNSSRSQNVRVEQPPDAGPSVIPVEGEGEDNPDLDAVGEDDHEMDVQDIVRAHREAGATSSTPSEHLEHLGSDDGTPMLNPEELLTQESLASPPPS